MATLYGGRPEVSKFQVTRYPLGPDCMEGPHPQIDDYLAGQLTRIYYTILFSNVVLSKAGTG